MIYSRNMLLLVATIGAAAVPAAAGTLSAGEPGILLSIATYGLEWMAEANALLATSEPETWMMLLGGIGLIGSTLRRRNRAFDRRQLV